MTSKKSRSNNVSLTRRTVLGGAAGAAVMSPALVQPARADGPFSDGFAFDLQRTEEEWRAMLSEEEYRILREGGTEKRFTSALADETRPGTYYCKGSDVAIYTSEDKVQLPYGWVFFSHAIPDTVMLGVDIRPEEYNQTTMTTRERQSLIEVHCQRSGSHLGHIVSIEGKVVHCINGTALNFVPSTA